MTTVAEWVAGGGGGLAVLGLLWRNRGGIGAAFRTIVTGQSEVTHTSIAAISESVNALKIIVDSQSTALSRQDTRLEVLEARVTARDLRIEALETELRHTREQLDTARTELNKRDIRITQLEARIEALQGELVAARTSTP